jgi:hypothetical protein
MRREIFNPFLAGARESFEFTRAPSARLFHFVPTFFSRPFAFESLLEFINQRQRKGGQQETIGTRRE